MQRGKPNRERGGTMHEMSRSHSGNAFSAAVYLGMTLLMFIAIYPLYYSLVASFSDAKSLLSTYGPLWAPLQPYTLRGYMLSFMNRGIVIGFQNTVVYVVAGTVLGLVLTTLGAYCTSRKQFMIRGLAMKMILVTMFFSGGIIPLFFIVRGVGIYNTRWSFFLPYAISSYNLIIMRTFFLSIPETLEEAARLDGANDLQILFHVYIPLSTAVIAVITMYYGVGYWNSWYQALMFMRNRDLYPLQMFLREVLITNQSQNTAADVTSMAGQSFDRELIKYCTVVISTVPILVIYPFLQRYFVKGVMMGAIKG